MKPCFETSSGILYQGHVLGVLKELPDKSVQCCATSPPYWGLRDYGLEPQIWDDLGDCEHEWGDVLISKANDSNRGTMEWTTGGDPAVKVKGEKSSQGQFCQKCNAWRGSLGLEPTPELFVSHIVQIFREVKRILKNDGVLWLNLGDSYSGVFSGNNGYKDGRSNRNKGQGPGLVRGLKPKDLVGIPWRVAFALQADGWYLRQDIIWHKPNPMPERVTDRCTKAHEYIFLLSKSAKYFYDHEAIKEAATYGKPSSPHSIKSPHGQGFTRNAIKTKIPSGWDTKKGGHSTIHREGRSDTEYQQVEETVSRNKRSVWTIEDHTALLEWLYKTNPEILKQFYDQVPDVFNIATHSFKEAHFATFPEKLIEPCILAGTRTGDTVIDPFFGAGTTGVVAYKHGRKFIGIELSSEYCEIAAKRIEHETQQMKLFR